MDVYGERLNTEVILGLTGKSACGLGLDKQSQIVSLTAVAVCFFLRVSAA